MSPKRFEEITAVIASFVLTVADEDDTTWRELTPNQINNFAPWINLSVEEFTVWCDKMNEKAGRILLYKENFSDN